MDTAIFTQALTKRYRTQRKDRPAIVNVSLQVAVGQLYGLVGPDGAGKTTAIRLLSTVLVPTSGTARIVGFDVVKQAEKARPLIGYMPQAFSLYPDLSVIENLNFFANVHRVPAGRRKERIPELLAFARLEAFQSRRSKDLSGGMRKKLALACAMVHDPQILLLDEPTTGVDPVSRRELWRILAEVVQQGVTVLVSTPYMDEAERCHHIAILYDGRLLTSGAPAELEAQLPFDVLEVKTNSRRLTRQLVNQTKGIQRWRPVGDRLRLSVQHLDDVCAHLRSACQEAGAEGLLLRQVRPTMEDVFIHLVETQQAGPLESGAANYRRLTEDRDL